MAKNTRVNSFTDIEDLNPWRVVLVLVLVVLVSFGLLFFFFIWMIILQKPFHRDLYFSRAAKLILLLLLPTTKLIVRLF